jgi:hypothetical protein
MSKNVFVITVTRSMRSYASRIVNFKRSGISNA